MSKFVPKIDSTLTISLPGELLRATVLKVVTPDSVIVEIVTEPLAKSHNYKFHDVIVCRRSQTAFGEEWEAKPKGIISIQDLVKQEEEDAVKSRVKPISDKQKHKRADSPRGKVKKSRTDSGNSIGKRKKASKGK